MPKLIYAYLASLDGHVADADGDVGWAVPDEGVLGVLDALEGGVGTYRYGRRIYEMMAGWETDPEYAAQSPQSAAFAGVRTAAEEVVFSRTLESVSTSRTRLERELDPELVRRLEAEATSDLHVSGAELAAAAWRADLIDECWVVVAPVIVGGGKRLFPEGVHRPLELVDRRRFAGGMVLLRYAVPG